MKFQQATLPNGLEVVAECNPEAHSLAVGFFVQTGARDESAGIAGVSHFLEHMMFKGTPTRSADDVNREFDEMGASYNAFTSEENTVYYATVLPEFQARVVELWADCLRPALREADFATEKKVIIEEIRMYDDQPPFGAHEKCMAQHFGSHPLGQSVLGTVESIEALPVEAMREYFRLRYSPRNLALVAAGRVDFAALVEAAERHCGHWDRFDTSRDTPPALANRGFTSLHRATATQQYVVQLSAGPAHDDPQRYAARVLATMLGDDTGSRFYWELVDPGLVEHASLGYSEYQGAGLFGTFLSCDPEFAADNVQTLSDIYRIAEADGFTREEFEQALSKINSRLVLGSERPRGRMFNVGSNWVRRREYRAMQDELAAYRAVTLDDVHAVLARYPLSASTTVTIGPVAELKPPV